MVPKYCNNIDMPLRPDQEQKLERKREKLRRLRKRIAKKFGQRLTDADVRVLSQALASHPNARTSLLRDRNYGNVISLLETDYESCGAAQVVRKLAAEGVLMAV